MLPQVDRAAIQTDEGNIFSVARPGRHHDVIREIRESGYKGAVGGERQGFVLSDGRFVTRKEALQVAIETKQVEYYMCHAPMVGLFSEDIW